MNEVYDDMRAANRVVGSAYEKRVAKVKIRLQRDWKKTTPDEIDMAIRSINHVFGDSNYSGELVELIIQLRDKMGEQIPEYMI